MGSKNCSTQETVGRVLQIVSHLGGPEYESEDLKWAADIPVGKHLLEWLATQSLSAHSNHHGAESPGPVADTLILQNSLSPVALYRDELDLLACLKSKSSGKPTTSGGVCPSHVTSASYTLPSQLRARTNTAQSEVVLLENGTTRLQHRLNASKTASKALKQTIQTLRNQVQTADENINTQQQRLTDLSAYADGMISEHANLALRALSDHSVAPFTENSNVRYDFESLITSLSTSRGVVAGSVQELYQTVDDGYSSMFTTAEVQRHAELLHAKMKEFAKDQSRLDDLVQAAYVEELKSTVKRLEETIRTEETEAIARILDSNGDRLRNATSTITVDVKGELERAGRMDRLFLLEHQEKGVDSIIHVMGEQVVPQTKKTYDALHKKSAVVAETEAIVSALIEELEDMNDAVQSATRLAGIAKDEAMENSESLLETEVVQLLKNLLGQHGERPTVLLNRSDIDTELAVLAQKVSVSSLAEEKWTGGVREHLNQLSSGCAPLLSTAYVNSPVNTSPPFAPKTVLVALQNSTRAMADELTSSAARLQKETELNTRDERKLGTFVEKWIST